MVKNGWGLLRPVLPPTHRPFASSQLRGAPPDHRRCATRDIDLPKPPQFWPGPKPQGPRQPPCCINCPTCDDVSPKRFSISLQRSETLKVSPTCHELQLKLLAQTTWPPNPSHVCEHSPSSLSSHMAPSNARHAVFGAFRQSIGALLWSMKSAVMVSERGQLLRRHHFASLAGRGPT